MTKFEEKKFNIGELKDISVKTIEEHLKLYAGYVKHANLILEKIAELSTDSDKNAYALAEVQRRFGFEFNGMKNHEYYFEQFEGGAKTFDTSSALTHALGAEFGSFDAWVARFKTIAMTRGIGWAMLYYDKKSKALVHAWVDEQHLGQLVDTQIILALDMWEHSYMLDRAPSDKKTYVEAFFANLNSEVVEKRFADALTVGA